MLSLKIHSAATKVFFRNWAIPLAPIDSYHDEFGGGVEELLCNISINYYKFKMPTYVPPPIFHVGLSYSAVLLHRMRSTNTTKK